MRLELLWNPRLLCERLAEASRQRRRLSTLRRTPGAWLRPGHIDSLELLEMARGEGIGVIYDIGASVGTWTLLAKSIIPGAKVVAFEPLGERHKDFAQNCRALSGVSLHTVALGSENSAKQLRVTNVLDSSSFLPLAKGGRDKFGLSEVGQTAASMRRLDDYRSEVALPLPDLIKLDVQGYEVEVLKGASECLATAKCVIAEVSFVEYYSGQCMLHEVLATLAQHGLYCRAVSYKTPVGRPLEQTDVLFVRPNTVLGRLSSHT